MVKTVLKPNLELDLRYLHHPILKDLAKKMVFISGPRQCGKTTLAKNILDEYTRGAYLNWDNTDDRKVISRREWSEDRELVVFDELHKFSKWRNWLKGQYDKNRPQQNYLITGSARLDIYRRGGDSLLGRYHHWRLHPFCLAEHPASIGRSTAFQRLLDVGGFPEPFINGDPIEAKRWRKERRDLVLREDLRDLERVREISSVGLLLDLLSNRVGGPVVHSNLAEDLEVAPKTVKHWIDILRRLYLVFEVSPYSKSLARGLKKASKIYFYDNSEVGDAEGRGTRFENMVANHLLKRIQFLEDSLGDRYELRHLRDKEKHEVDFLILKDGKPHCLIEAKWSEDTPSPSLGYFGDRLKVQNRIQVVAEAKKTSVRNGVSIVSATDWLARPLTDERVFDSAIAV